MPRSPLVILFVTVFLDLLGFGLVIPFMAYTVESFGASATMVGLLASSYSLAQLVCAPLWGRISDRVGRRPILLLGLLGSSAGYLLFGVAGSLAVLFCGRILAGVAGATIPTAQAYIADVTTQENRAKGMGLIGAAFGLGFVVGPALGGLLAPLGPQLGAWLSARGLTLLALPLVGQPYALPSIVASILSLCAFLAAVFLLPSRSRPRCRPRQAPAHVRDAWRRSPRHGTTRP